LVRFSGLIGANDYQRASVVFQSYWPLYVCVSDVLLSPSAYPGHVRAQQVKEFVSVRSLHAVYEYCKPMCEGCAHACAAGSVCTQTQSSHRVCVQHAECTSTRLNVQGVRMLSRHNNLGAPSQIWAAQRRKEAK
jgi:hypothetical protein